MVYKFDAEWNGKVLAESKGERIDSYMGLQFPASDIPAQARALYETNWVRIIPNVAYEPCDISPRSDGHGSTPLDLSYAVLRSVSPIHIQYLKNMQVGASASVSVLRNGRLWGLIAFHHETARFLPYELRQGLEFIGKFFSLQLVAKERDENKDLKQELKRRQVLFSKKMRESVSLVDGLKECREDLLAFIAHSGRLRDLLPE